MRRVARVADIGEGQAAEHVAPLRLLESASSPLSTTVRNFGIMLSVATVVFIAALVWVESRTPTLRLTRDTLSVAAGVYRAKLAVSAIDSVALTWRLGRIGLKSAGYSFGNVYHGAFAMRDYGKARLFVNTGRPAFVIVHSAAGVVIVSLDDSLRSRMLSDSIAAVHRSARNR
jgi:Bacterial PH domain